MSPSLVHYGAMKVSDNSSARHKNTLENFADYYKICQHTKMIDYSLLISLLCNLGVNFPPYNDDKMTDGEATLKITCYGTH